MKFSFCSLWYLFLPVKLTFYLLARQSVQPPLARDGSPLRNVAQSADGCCPRRQWFQHPRAEERHGQSSTSLAALLLLLPGLAWRGWSTRQALGQALGRCSSCSSFIPPPDSPGHEGAAGHRARATFLPHMGTAEGTPEKDESSRLRAQVTGPCCRSAPGQRRLSARRPPGGLPLSSMSGQFADRARGALLDVPHPERLLCGRSELASPSRETPRLLAPGSEDGPALFPAGSARGTCLSVLSE